MACNAFGIEILEEGDWNAVLNEASGLYVASDPMTGTPLAFLVYIDFGRSLTARDFIVGV